MDAGSIPAISTSNKTPTSVGFLFDFGIRSEQPALLASGIESRSVMRVCEVKRSKVSIARRGREKFSSENLFVTDSRHLHIKQKPDFLSGFCLIWQLIILHVFNRGFFNYPVLLILNYTSIFTDSKHVIISLIINTYYIVPSIL